MNTIREYIGHMTNKQLWDLFEEHEQYEVTGSVASESELRRIAIQKVTSGAPVIGMHVVAHEVFRELAKRGAPCTIFTE